MSEGCPRPAPAGRPVRGPHGGWQQQEIDVLERTVSEAAQTGQSLRSVFERVSEELGRKPNSIRNFYYAQLRTQEGGAAPRALPFETFAPEEVEQLVERVGLAPRAVDGKMVEQFSTGMKKRLHFAILLASEADVWLLDEPGANLDAVGRSMVRREARLAADGGKLVLLATNDREEEAEADACISLSGR